MSETAFVPAALFASGYQSGEIHAIVGTDHSAFVAASYVRADRLPANPEDQVNGQVLVFVIQRGPTETLVELPGIAVGGLRGWVPSANVVPGP